MPTKTRSKSKKPIEKISEMAGASPDLEPDGNDVQGEDQSPEETPDDETKADPLRIAAIEIPIGETPPSEFALHIDTRLSVNQSTTLRRLADALDRQNATLEGGRRVTNPTGAMRWLIEQVAATL